MSDDEMEFFELPDTHTHSTGCSEGEFDEDLNDEKPETDQAHTDNVCVNIRLFNRLCWG